MRYKHLEKIVKGFANHRRIQILNLVSDSPNLSLNEISTRLKINIKTASEHTRRLQLAGLIEKKYQGAKVLHNISQLGTIILKFLRILE